VNRVTRLAGVLALAATVLPATPAFAAGFAAAAPIGAAAPAPTLAGKTIVVDPGHGGRDPGTIDNGIKEKDLTLAMGLALKPLLESRGARVLMTRTSDVALGSSVDPDLQARVDVAQRNKANAFVSIHVNHASDPNYSGATTYFGPNCGFRSGVSESAGDVGRSYSLGRRIQSQIVGLAHATDRGTRSEVFWVLGNPGVPAVLVETGFLSNGGEAAKLADSGYQGQMVRAIADGITDFFASGDAGREPQAPASALAPCTAPPPAQEPQATWVQTFLPAPLLSGPDPNSVQFTTLNPFFYLKVLGQAKNNYLYVFNPETNGAAFVEAGKVGPSGPPPTFKPFWVENFAPTGVWSAADGGMQFGTAARWSFFQVVQPQEGSRLFVRVAATGNVAYVDARDVGPSGAPA
jgi:N-acetylmuramoyl-L-alanine amidase